MQHAFTAANEGSFTRQPLGALLKTYAEVGNAEQYLFLPVWDREAFTQWFWLDELAADQILVPKVEVSPKI